MTTLYAAQWLLPVTCPPIPDGAVAVTADLITAVGPRAELKARFPNAPVRDLGDAAILPGLINTHSHLELTAFRGRLEEPHFQRWIVALIGLKAERLSQSDLLGSARLGCLEALRAGVTTLADTADSDSVLEALIESGQRAIIYRECFGPHPEQADASLHALRAKLAAQGDRLAQANQEAQKRLRLGVSPHAPYSVSARLYEQVAVLALAEKLDVAIHAAESLEEVQLLKDGTGAFAASLRRREIPFHPPQTSTVKYLHQLGVLETAPLLIHGVTMDAEDIELLARHQSRVAHCPKSNAKFGHGIMPLVELKQAGVSVGLGSDSVASNNACDLLEEGRFCGLLHRAHRRDASLLSAGELLEMLTIDGAKALGLEHEVGSLEAGKQADLIAVDLSRAHNTPHYDPATAILFSCSAQDVILTMVSGATLYDHGQVVTFDAETVKRRAKEVQKRLA